MSAWFEQNLLFQEEIAFPAPRNLFTAFVGRFQVDFSVLLKFSFIIALCRAVGCGRCRAGSMAPSLHPSPGIELKLSGIFS